ncbi:NADAR family protein [Ancylothrix sp. C2]|uniref:NADAR family protein n=1 Tax=Ancylothrix sp. D3o TaxID=2953691 RepID=UPI0021BADF34|nr:NADAR family protein [Ancylothrix sp. D3o]MCT7950644.1 NADAR family protein [Ancylothrix sp. D3o]
MTIYFYKVSDPYGYLSNFSPHGIHLGGLDWPTVEHYYQAQKFAGSQCEAIIPQIHSAPTPQEAAALGRDPCRILRPDWEQTKYNIMREAVLTKFLTHRDIQTLLLATGDEIIVEDSPRDYYWGCGADKTGQNQLGKILMSVRLEIRHRLGQQ